jgi:hypothetical protein
MSTPSPTGAAGKDAEELISVKELADELGIAESTAWLHVRRHRLQKYRVPSRGKTTLVRRGDAVAAYHRPVLIGEDDSKKAAA